MIFEYEEFVSKRKGTVVRIMNLKEYIEKLPKDEITDNPNSDHIYTTCPYCMHEAYKEDRDYHGQPYIKHKLGITRDLKVGQCWRCHAAYITSDFSARFELPDFTTELGSLSVSDLNFTMKDKRYKLEDYDQKFTELNYDYKMRLYRRNPYILGFKDLGFKVTHDGYLAIPFMWKGKLIYYQVWQYPQAPKYYNPAVSNKPFYICGDIKHEAILVEGVFDAIACRTLYKDKTPIALIGSTLTYAQEIMLRSLMFDKITICMDDTSLSWKLHNKIHTRFDLTDLEIMESDGEDAEEKLNRLLKIKYENSQK